MTNPILLLLSSEILTGEIFAKWKSNMNILLINENYQFVLKEDCPPAPPANASRTVSQAYNNWIVANNKARCYLLAAMNEVLRAKHEALETAKGIMESLQQMFGRPSEQARHEAVKAVMKCKMKNGSSVRDHVLKLINHFNDAEINGANIDEKTQVGMILETLSPAFLQFRTNYVMNHRVYNMTQLLNELQSYESMIDDKNGKANVVEANVAVGKASSSKNTKKKNVGKFKGKKKIQKKKGKGVELNRKENVSIAMWMAIGKGNMLESSKDLEEGAFMMRVGSGERLSATTVGTVRLSFKNNKFLLLNNVYFIPGFQRNLISVSKLHEQFIFVSFEIDSVSINKNERIEKLVKDGPLKELKVGSLPVCESCPERKMTKRQFLAKGERAKAPLEIIHSNHNYIKDFKPRSKVVLEELLADEISPIQTRVVEQERVENNTQDPTPPPPPRRSEKEIRLPIRYREEGEAQVAVTDGGDDDPLTYKMAMIDVDQEKWQEAMKLEMESMCSNSVWTLVDQPEGVKPIG
ncbi:uncharacterized protein [Henckelia pumila]|uniref:uncharacterized protein n=1 Tax=Henckelia pumila TaxID=405737 RepID=UPI003C6E5E27